MSSIFEIENNLLEIFQEIEENYGEITEELEQRLTISKEEFKNKVEGYVNYTKQLEGECRTIDDEIARLEALKKGKEKTINKLQENLINAIQMFGDETKTGTKYVDYGTGKVSIKTTKAVEVNNDSVKKVADSIQREIQWLKSTNQLFTTDVIPVDEYMKSVVWGVDEPLTREELNQINLDVTLKIPIADVDINGFEILRQVFNYTDTANIKGSVSKSAIKNSLKENGNNNLAQIKENKSLTIK